MARFKVSFKELKDGYRMDVFDRVTQEYTSRPIDDLDDSKRIAKQMVHDIKKKYYKDLIKNGFELD